MNKIMLALSSFALGFIFLYHLGLPALLDSDETRYADMARGMFLSKDFITPYLDGRIFWDKPPLFFWLLCLSYKCLGISEFSVRIPSVLSALTAILALFFAVKKTATTYGTQYVKITDFNNSFNGYVVVIENEEMPKLTIKYNIIKKDKRYSLIEENHE